MSEIMRELVNSLNGGRVLRILMLEDSEDDEILIREELKEANVLFTCKRVAEKEEYIRALEEFSPDIILSDYNLPDFDGLEALELKNFYNLDIIPLLFVTGFLGEERAVEAIKKGASDFILKGNLRRLPRAVLTALRENLEKRRRLELEVTSRRNEAKYRHLIEQAADGIFIGDELSHFMEVNSRACEILGFSREELLQMKAKDLVPEGAPFPDWKQIPVGEVYRYESFRKRKDGSVFPVEVSVTKTTYGFYQAIMRDISRRKKTEKALQEAIQRLEFHMANSPLGIVEFDRNGSIKRWTEQAERMFGWSEEEALGKHPLEIKLLEQQDLEKVREIVAAKLQEQKNHFTYSSPAFTKEGKKVYCEWYNSVFRGENGALESMLTLVNDVTVKKVAEEARLEGQMQERKRVAREIHEGIGQMLVATKFKLASIDFAQEAEDKLNEMEELLEKGIEEVRRVSLNMAPRSVEQIGIETAIRQLVEQVQRLTGIEITFQYIGQSRKADNSILSSIYRLTQESLNNVMMYSHASKVKLELNQREYEIELRIEDNGKGFAAEENILNGDSGLGSMKERIHSLGGQYRLQPKRPSGTELLVKIPLEDR